MKHWLKLRGGELDEEVVDQVQTESFFFIGFCLLALSLIAGRVMPRHLVSEFDWTVSAALTLGWAFLSVQRDVVKLEKEIEDLRKKVEGK